MYKYKIVIADDEGIVADTIKEILKKEVPDIEVVAVFYDGKSVLEYIESNPVDIIISDICMPDATGIDIIHTVYEMQYNIQIVLITGYERFEYAKEAINYHVRAFLTKPIDFGELIYQVKSLVLERESEVKNIHALELIKLHDHKIARRVFSFFYEGKYDFKHILQLQKNKNQTVDYSECNFMVQTFSWNKRLPYASAFRDICESRCPRYETYCIIEDEKKAVTVYLYYDKQEIMQLAEEHKRMLHLIYSVDVHVSTEYEGKLSDYHPTGYLNLAKQYFSALHSGNAYDIEKLEKIVKEDFSVQELRSFINGLLEYLSEKFDKIPIGKVEVADAANKDDLYKLIDSLAKYIISLQNVEVDKFDDVMNYIRCGCSYDFSLVTIADKFDVSPTYLSKMIKKRTGLKFYEFVFKIRMTKAKEMLEQGISISEIAFAVGYNSKEYFSKVFKDYTGISPKEYKERINRYEKNTEKP